ncbi:hypothetical protein ACFO26_05940 [Lactococcus nasutitermitis]|uniref:Uncharacterized protein n=1 Tax=Lactococcus nasutitermitis TaxID=1652957 RepID=A0ABV9JG05_9LACT|nr:hypothetical protein [Lactococcus nasutitermitis]
MVENELTKNDSLLYLELEHFTHYLSFISENLLYSEINVRLILAQLPTAKKVLTFERWSKMGNGIKAKSQPLKILTPRYIVKRDENNHYLATEDGEKMIEKIEILNPCLFDISQTLHPEQQKFPLFNLPEERKLMERDAKLYSGLKKIIPQKIVFEQLERDEFSIFLPENNRLIIKQGLGKERTLQELFTWLAQCELLSQKSQQDDEIQQFEAQAIAYSLSQHFFISCSEFRSFEILEQWKKSSMSAEDFQKILEIITTTTHVLVKKLDKTFSVTFDVTAGKNPFETRLIAARNERLGIINLPVSSVIQPPASSSISSSSEPISSSAGLKQRLSVGNKTLGQNVKSQRKEANGTNDE